ncbi:Ppx/GppA family phosphatase [Sphingomonas aracearum]|uniref:Ppx/GppA family phosphatase n=1 Tax=Sphingomonas aracearum TaxID=2283317 RepID=A0A369VZ65_9SPHN|nr:Ppx/GppA family phosphatase [Sphingomonas aracearum]RDE06352.1 Ppx/GppA family phosphatase [Sphingomonas aracearum]
MFGRKERSGKRTAIIDIGSNSIRLVVYEGPERLPAILFNEKVMAGLGRGVAEDGRLSDEGLAAARDALARFVAVAREMDVAGLRIVATAAVRDAANGEELLSHIRALGQEVELLSGEQEALGAGYGVLSGIPDADGIVGDLGGGSLELVRIAAGTVTDRASFPLGVLRLPAIRERGKEALERTVAKLLGDAGWKGRGEDLPFYLVGGSWRALARLDMHLTDYPLPVMHQYEINRDALSRLRRTISHVPKSALRTTPGVSSARANNLDDATALLSIVLKQLKSRTAITSAFGLREGLLYGALDSRTRQQDPLIVAAREEGRQLGRFPEHGDLLERWIAPLFAGETAEMARLRHAACLLADVGWRANPEFRAERGIEVALHGNWVAIDAAGRAILAQALFTSLCGEARSPDPLARLAAAEDLAQAAAWGFAMRLGQRLSGGVAGPLERSTVARTQSTLHLDLTSGDRALYGEAVTRRHKALASYLGLEPAVG